MRKDQKPRVPEKFLSEDQIREFLKSIEIGEITLVPLGKELPQETNGNVVYRASNGWQIAVFNDCGEFDYIDWIEDENGNGSPEFGYADTYQPADEVAWDRYRIPGYCNRRCEICGVEMLESHPSYLCATHRK